MNSRHGEVKLVDTDAKAKAEKGKQPVSSTQGRGQPDDPATDRKESKQTEQAPYDEANINDSPTSATSEITVIRSGDDKDDASISTTSSQRAKYSFRLNNSGSSRGFTPWSAKSTASVSISDENHAKGKWSLRQAVSPTRKGRRSIAEKDLTTLLAKSNAQAEDEDVVINDDEVIRRTSAEAHSQTLRESSIDSIDFQQQKLVEQFRELKGTHDDIVERLSLGEHSDTSSDSSGHDVPAFIRKHSVPAMQELRSLPAARTDQQIAHAEERFRRLRTPSSELPKHRKHSMPSAAESQSPPSPKNKQMIVDAQARLRSHRISSSESQKHGKHIQHIPTEDEINENTRPFNDLNLPGHPYVSFANPPVSAVQSSRPSVQRSSSDGSVEGTWKGKHRRRSVVD